MACGPQTHTIDIPDKLVPVFIGPARYRGAYGGRGSGKTRTFAKMAATHGAKCAAAGKRGVILCCREFVASLADSSFSEVREAIASDEWLSSVYEVGREYIRTRDGNVEFAFAGLRYNVSSLKSKALILLCWVDEADRVSEEAWIALEPTVRETGSEIWVTWNPERKGSATDVNFRVNATSDMKIVELNWRDNPWFPAELDDLRRRHKLTKPEQYDHIWEGGYATAAVGAYYAAELLNAKESGRICALEPDPLLTVYSHHDIGGEGAQADNYSIWISQRVAGEIRVLDHYTARGQPLSAHVYWMRQRGWDKAQIVLPHDGGYRGGPAGTWADAWRSSGFEDVRVVPNLGGGAKMFRIEQARRWFPRMRFDAERTEAGRMSLAMYAPHISRETGADLGPRHDQYSHDADAFGLLACDYQEPIGFNMQSMPQVRLDAAPPGRARKRW